MTHPITPPPELVQQWLDEPEYVSDWEGTCTLITITDHRLKNICVKSAQWGADQELEACCHEVQNMYSGGTRLRAARRPKPPSLKEQALEALKALQQRTTDPNIVEPLRRALEQLDD